MGSMCRHGFSPAPCLLFSQFQQLHVRKKAWQAECNDKNMEIIRLWKNRNGIMRNKHTHIYTYSTYMQASMHPFVLGMSISISEADAILISMHIQWYDTLKIHMKQLAMRYDSPLLQCSAIRFRFDTMRFDAMEKYDRFYFFGSDRQQIIS